MTRDHNIDLLRFVGLSLIILAHVTPPSIVLNLRCFDVPLMVFVSGLTCYQKDIQFSWGYLSHRFARLVFPVWIFLTVYFLMIYAAKFVGLDFGLTFKQVYESYLLMDGIGFVWIIRVLLLIALVTPGLIKINQTIKSDTLFIWLYSIVLILYLLIAYYKEGMDIALVRDWVYYAIGYGFVFLLGIRMKGLKCVDIMLFASIMMAFFITLGVLDKYSLLGNDSVFLHVNDWKYPPTNIFLLYGLIMSILCYMVIYLKQRVKLNGVVNFIGCNSIWIYLWHIPFISITARMEMVWWLRFVIIYLGAAGNYFLQYSLINWIGKRKNYKLFKYLIG